MSTERILKDTTNSKEKDLVMRPSLYRVIFFNDHFTTMEFVVIVLKDIFQKTRQEAVQIMLDVHRDGQSIVGIFSYDIAKTKVDLVRRRAREEEFPLKCTCEKA